MCRLWKTTEGMSFVQTKYCKDCQSIQKLEYEQERFGYGLYCAGHKLVFLVKINDLIDFQEGIKILLLPILWGLFELYHNLGFSLYYRINIFCINKILCSLVNLHSFCLNQTHVKLEYTLELELEGKITQLHTTEAFIFHKLTVQMIV